HMRLPFYVWDMIDKKNYLIKKKIDFKKIKKEKTRFCNFVYSNDIPIRNEFFKKLSSYKKIDSFGTCFNNMGPLPIKTESTYKPLSLLKKYKFTIAFETTLHPSPGYTTEKILEPMLANSIPIYWGNPKVEEEFNTKSFLNYPDFKNEDELIKKIIEIDNDDKLYEEYLKQPWFKDNRPNIYFDEERLLKRFEEIFG
ncbi:MAG: glycosyltransferase family 10, partial [archaeon]